jgi:hypothetical protein
VILILEDRGYLGGYASWSSVSGCYFSSHLGAWPMVERGSYFKVSCIFQQSQGISDWFLILVFLDKKGHTLLLLDGADL